MTTFDERLASRNSTYKIALFVGCIACSLLGFSSLYHRVQLQMMGTLEKATVVNTKATPFMGPKGVTVSLVGPGDLTFSENGVLLFLLPGGPGVKLDAYCSYSECKLSHTSFFLSDLCFCILGCLAGVILLGEYLPSRTSEFGIPQFGVLYSIHTFLILSLGIAFGVVGIAAAIVFFSIPW